MIAYLKTIIGVHYHYLYVLLYYYGALKKLINFIRIVKIKIGYYIKRLFKIKLL